MKLAINILKFINNSLTCDANKILFAVNICPRGTTIWGSPSVTHHVTYGRIDIFEVIHQTLYELYLKTVTIVFWLKIIATHMGLLFRGRKFGAALHCCVSGFNMFVNVIFYLLSAHSYVLVISTRDNNVLLQFSEILAFRRVTIPAIESLRCTVKVGGVKL